MTPRIHSTAIIHPNAQIGDNVKIGPFSLVEADCCIDRDSTLGSHVVIKSGTHIGSNCFIDTGSSIGGLPQDVNFNGEKSNTSIGNNTSIREFSVIHRSTQPGGTTIIGDNCILMANSHVGHDCQVGNHVQLTNFVGLAGYSVIGNNAVMGAYAGCYQHCRIGSYAMIGAMTKVSQDVPPFLMAVETPCKLVGINQIGLMRGNYSKDHVTMIKKVFIAIFRKNQPVEQVLETYSGMLPDSHPVFEMLNFIRIKSKRGILRKLR